MKKLVLAGVAIVGISGFTLAADPPVYDSAPTVLPLHHGASPVNWHGVYVGGTAGYGAGNYQLFDESGTGPDVAVTGFVGGATVGANMQNGSVVWGIEADIQNGPKGTTAQFTSGDSWSCFSGDCNASINWFATLRGRLGVASGNWLFYGTAGLAHGNTTGGIFNSATQGGGSATGWTGGLGAEAAFGPGSAWSAKGEFLHVNLGDIPFGTGNFTEPFLGSGSFNVIRFGLNYRFGGHESQSPVSVGY
jgi:outer membrane immunogenic protein